MKGRTIGTYTKVKGERCMVIPAEAWGAFVTTLREQLGGEDESTFRGGCEAACEEACSGNGGCDTCWASGGICADGTPYIMV